ncbi:PREDICTED: inositol-tetrakisphosphate 1-kinase [Hipposideros armiger]|uniref:inositol-1,3,4-trisphosphate 5/6-kinase n=1 Tax=Hipposideros armiger TaxID=186990 RepID=A0A8B7QJY9_HIPAR|nr:PREDICTED: inositol-tetrakisphosphate 1-kinase [Hipposideros armiger]
MGGRCPALSGAGSGWGSGSEGAVPAEGHNANPSSWSPAGSVGLATPKAHSAWQSAPRVEIGGTSPAGCLFSPGSSPGPSLAPPVWTVSGRSCGRTVGHTRAARGPRAPLAGRTPDRESIFFNSHNVSKPESSSVLTELDKIEGVFERPSDEVIRELSRALRQALGVSLFGIDIIINNQTGQHAVIDINAFPGYEGVSEFFTDLLNHIATVLQGQSAATAAVGDVAPLRRSRLLTEQAGGLAGERTCSASPGCSSSVMGQDPPWMAEADAAGVGASSTTKLPHQRLGCTTAVSPSFQQHCVASLATKASSQ